MNDSLTDPYTPSDAASSTLACSMSSTAATSAAIFSAQCSPEAQSGNSNSQIRLEFICPWYQNLRLLPVISCRRIVFPRSVTMGYFSGIQQALQQTSQFNCPFSGPISGRVAALQHSSRSVNVQAVVACSPVSPPSPCIAAPEEVLAAGQHNPALRVRLLQPRISRASLPHHALQSVSRPLRQSVQDLVVGRLVRHEYVPVSFEPPMMIQAARRDLNRAGVLVSEPEQPAAALGAKRAARDIRASVPFQPAIPE